MNTKLYTSRYSNSTLLDENIVKIGITRGQPKWTLPYKLEGNIIELAPPGYLFGETDREAFTPLFFKHLDRVGKGNVMRLLEQYGYGEVEEMALLCYEDVRNPHEWCHREVCGEWIKSRLGIHVEELRDPSQSKWEKEEETRKNKEAKDLAKKQKADEKARKEQERLEEERKWREAQVSLF